MQTTIRMFLFEVRLQIDGAPVILNYSSVDECLTDDGLAALFNAGHIEACAIYQGPKRITAPPVMTWARFRTSLVANATAILTNQGD